MTDSIADIFAEFLANPLVSSGLTLLGIALLSLWLAAAWWAYQDAARRSESTLVAFIAAAWIIVSTPLLLPVALAIYRFARPQVTAAEHRARSMARELGTVIEGPACPSCQLPIDASWLRCPACAVWLAAPCRSCGVWATRALEACPFCGSEEHAAPAVDTEAAPALPVRPAVAVGPGLPSRAGMPVGSLVPARAAQHGAGHGTAAAGAWPAAAVKQRAQRVASSARPRSYAASRDTSSISS